MVVALRAGHAKVSEFDGWVQVPDLNPTVSTCKKFRTNAILCIEFCKDKPSQNLVKGTPTKPIKLLLWRRAPAHASTL